jgi:hypothetical protein
LTIILSRVVYFAASTISKNKNDVNLSLTYYKIANFIRYVLLSVANFFNIVAFVYTNNSIYLIIVFIILALLFAYKYRITDFKKYFLSDINIVNESHIRTYFE